MFGECLLQESTLYRNNVQENLREIVYCQKILICEARCYVTIS